VKSYGDLQLETIGNAQFRNVVIEKVTTIQRNALTVTEGRLVYNTDNDRFEYYETTSSSWKPLLFNPSRIADSGDVTFFDMVSPIANAINSGLPATSNHFASEPFHASPISGITILGATGNAAGAGDTGTQITVRGGQARSASTGIGGSVTIQGGFKSVTSGSRGGSVNITGSDSDGDIGGNVIITAGDVTAGVASAGGAITLTSGFGRVSSSGGAITLLTGIASGSSGNSGTVSISTGTGNTTNTSGNITLTTGVGGSTSGNSGDVIIAPGTVTSGTVGTVQLGAANLKVPNTDGSAGGIMKTDGSGVLSLAAMQFIYNSNGGGGTATSHIVNHALGQQFVSTTVLDNSNNVIIPQNIVYTDSNNLTITFDIAIDCKVVVIGMPGIAVTVV